MIIPSIDLMGGQTVQLIGGAEHALDAGDPRPLAERFGRVGDIAVVDLDAALGRGSHETLIRDLLRRADCRVGGGIRTVEKARAWLDAGAVRVVLGTAAVAEVLKELPRERTIAALDARHNEVVVEGWTKGTGVSIESRMAELRELVGGFLVTFVEREGRMDGIPLERVKALVECARPARLTVAGGVTTADEVAAIDALGAECQVGMALYTGRLQLADAVGACLTSDRPDGLWPTVVSDELGTVLGLAYSSINSLRASLESGRVTYHSRQRGLWIKGETSGDTQTLVRLALDCDRDTLLYVVRQHGQGFCHNGTRTCFGHDRTIGQRLRELQSRKSSAPAGSYTRRLLDDPALLKAKLLEEAGELAAAPTSEEAVHEAADVLYFTMVAMVRHGITFEQVQDELLRRSRRLTRRPGDAK